MCGHAFTIGPAAGARIVLFSNPRWETGTVGAPEFTGYCSFTKALEHLGDRWSLLIVRQLGAFGPLGFNELTRALPGRISRSVLTERLRRLETLGLVSREGSSGYRLTTVGGGLMPVLYSLRGWAETWLPDDPPWWTAIPTSYSGGWPSGSARFTCPPSPWCWSSGHMSTVGATGW